MKVYTEVTYTWDDTKGELVEESSKSFDYDGEVTQCHSRTKRIGNRYVGYRNINIPHTHQSVADLKPKIKIDLKPPKPEIKIGGSLGEALDAGKTNLATATTAGKNVLHDAASATKTNLEYAADAGKSFSHKITDTLKTGMQGLGLHKKDKPGSDTTVGSKAAPGQSQTMGQGGQGGMETASMKTIRKKTVGGGGKRRLISKIKIKGSSGARV